MVPKNLRPLLPYLKKYRRGYALGTLCVFLTNGIWILFPQVIKRAIDDRSEERRVGKECRTRWWWSGEKKTAEDCTARELRLSHADLASALGYSSQNNHH